MHIVWQAQRPCYYPEEMSDRGLTVGDRKEESVTRTERESGFSSGRLVGANETSGELAKWHALAAEKLKNTLGLPNWKERLARTK